MTPFRISLIAAALVCAPALAASPQPGETAPALEFYVEGKWHDRAGAGQILRVWRSESFTRWEIEDNKLNEGLFVRRDAKDYFYNYSHTRGIYLMVQMSPDVMRQARSLRPVGQARWTKLGHETILGHKTTKWHVDGHWYYTVSKRRNVVCHFWLTDAGIELRFHCNEKTGAPESKFSFEATKLEIGKVNPRAFTFINDFRDMGRVKP